MERPLIDFSWTPTAGFVSFNIGANSYPPAGARYAASKTPLNTLVTFSAHASALPNQRFIHHNWDFGDGRRGSGVSVTHSYPFNVLETQVTLIVVDSRNREFHATKMINLHSDSPLFLMFSPVIIPE